MRDLTPWQIRHMEPHRGVACSDCRTTLGVHSRKSLAGDRVDRWPWTKGKEHIMSEPFRPYETLVEITIMGKKFQVTERYSLLR